MGLWQIALKNVWRNRKRYLAYLSSAALSVMIYFMYTALANHPNLQSGYSGARYAVEGIRAAAVVISIFTLLFLLYSAAAFIRSRMKEFGLLTLLGVSRRQLIRIILWESMLIAVASLASGLALGLLFLKLFFLAISVMLQLSEELPFYAGIEVWAQTILVFGSYFAVVSLVSLRSVIKRNIIEMVRAGRQPKALPTYSPWKTLLGLLLVAAGYGWASFPHPLIVASGIIPITAMVSVGTFFLLREGSIALLSHLHQRKGFFYRPGPFLTVSQLVYKMQDNYRILTAVSILMAVILSAIGAAVATYALTLDDTVASYPHAFQLVESGVSNPESERNRVEAVFEQLGLKMSRVELATQTGMLGNTSIALVPYSFYAHTQRPKGVTQQIDEELDAILVVPYFVPERRRSPQPLRHDRLILADQELEITWQADVSGRLFNVGSVGIYSLVVPDAVFADLMQGFPAERLEHITVWDTIVWQSRGAVTAATRLQSLYQNSAEFSSKALAYRASMSNMGLLLFISFFVSLVFFAASCSLLYFRFFTEIDEDRRYFRQLEQVGVGTRELQRLALGQSAVIFFTPYLAGLAHSTFAMQAASTMASRPLLQLGWLVAAAYLLLYTAYFAVTYTLYWRTLKAGLTG